MRILVANRGEIACRIIKSIQACNHQAVAVYSLADKDASHVKLADLSVCIGAENVTDSYLNMFNILSAATCLEVDMIHPGYGFLSENYVFASLCEQLQIEFIGPSSSSIKRMGDKINALEVMQKAAEGSNQFFEVFDSSDLVRISEAVEFPLIIKYANGGGGKGMRICKEPSTIENCYEMVCSEAGQIEANPRIFIEKYIENAKHIEVQVLCDKHGNKYSLGTRDCSMQRNSQKVIEEAPALISKEVSERLASIAIGICREIDYVGVGTVEFMVNGEGEYFLEMNTRLQVEHTVTEEVTGLDLVNLQIAVAKGEALNDLKFEIGGHAIECRINAEDPALGFMPMPGKIKTLNLPNGVRCDFGVEAGNVVSPFYDSMIGKIICYGSDRAEAIAKMESALTSLEISGVKTNIEFNRELIGCQAFMKNVHTTEYIKENIDKMELK